jgi:ribosomal protein S18 acetylase RimI-like enzyme
MSIAKILAKDCVCNSRGPQYKKALMDSLHGSVQERNEGKALAIIDLLDYIGAVLSNIGAIDYYELGMQGLPKEFRKVWLTSDILNVYRIGHGIQEDTSLPLIIQMAARRSFSANEDFDYASQCFEFTEKKMRDGSFTVIDGKVHRSNDGKDEIVKKEMLLINPESCSDQDFLWNTQLAIRLMRYDLRHELEKLFSPLPEAEKNAQTNHAYWHDYLGDEGDIFGKKSFTEKTSFKLGRLSYRELFFFAKFIANKTRPEMEPIIQFIKQYGVKGLRVFLATEQDSEMGSSILALGSQLPIKTAEKLFKKYCDIITASEQVAEYCEENIARNKKDTAPRLAIQNQLLQRGKKLLQTAATDLKRATTKEDRRFALATLRGELDHMRADILLFAATFKVAADHGSIRLEDVRSTELVTEQSNKIKDFEKKDMLRIYEENRPGYSPELLKETMREFESALATSGKKFYILKNNGVIVAFIRFDELANQDLYAGSLNVRPEARGSAIGSAMLIETLSKEGAMRDIKAVAYSRNPMLKHYIEDFGFAIVREIPDYHGTGELFYELKRPAGWKKETIAKKAA